MNEKVNVVKLNSANVKYDNSVDAERVYEIEANANLNGGSLVSMDGGSVALDGLQKASFSVYGNHQQSLNFHSVESLEEKCSIIAAIDGFASEVELAISVNPLNL